MDDALRLDASDGIMPLQFALFCFVVAGFALYAAFITAQVWLAATILLRLCEGNYVRATLWFSVLTFLVFVR
jgi:hypothetical protein